MLAVYDPFAPYLAQTHLEMTHRGFINTTKLLMEKDKLTQKCAVLQKMNHELLKKNEQQLKAKDDLMRQLERKHDDLMRQLERKHEDETSELKKQLADAIHHIDLILGVEALADGTTSSA